MLVIAAGYTLSLVLAGVVLGMPGLLPVDPNQAADAMDVFLWTFIGGLIMGLTLGLAARRLPASAARLRHA